MLLVLAAAKQVGLRCSQGFARSTGMCGSLAGWFQVAIQAVDWFVPGHHLSMGLIRCRFCEVHRRHLMHGGTQTIRFWGYNMSTGVKAPNRP